MRIGEEDPHAPAGFGVGAEEPVDPPMPAFDAVASGEEGEKQLIQLRVKLFKLTKKDDNYSWVDVGEGPLRLNVPAEENSAEGTTATKPRLIMRRQGVFKLLLNANITPQMTVEAVGSKVIRIAFQALAEETTSPDTPSQNGSSKPSSDTDKDDPQATTETEKQESSGPTRKATLVSYLIRFPREDDRNELLRLIETVQGGAKSQ